MFKDKMINAFKRAVDEVTDLDYIKCDPIQYDRGYGHVITGGYTVRITKSEKYYDNKKQIFYGVEFNSLKEEITQQEFDDLFSYIKNGRERLLSKLQREMEERDLIKLDKFLNSRIK